MSEGSEITVGRIAFSDDVWRAVRGEMPKIMEAVMTESETKKLTISEVRHTPGGSGFKVILSDGSELGGVERVAISGSQGFAGVEMLVRL